jgi:hypothetical protein
LKKKKTNPVLRSGDNRFCRKIFLFFLLGVLSSNDIFQSLGKQRHVFFKNSGRAFFAASKMMLGILSGTERKLQQKIIEW